MANSIKGWSGSWRATALWMIGAVLLAPSARAGFIEFTPTGSGASYMIGGIDPAPGSALAVSSLPLTLGATFQLDYQAAVPNLINTSGADFAPPGLNSTYQLTVVGSFTEVVTSLGAGFATFQVAPTQSSNSFFELYYNAPVVYSNLQGTGFNVGTLVIAGTPATNMPSVSVYSLATSGGNPVVVPFDQYTHQYPGIDTVQGSGAALLYVNVSYYNPAFVGTPISQISFNSSLVTPFNEVSPSAVFVGAPGTAPPTVVPNLGTINGVNGTDFQFQADSNLSFTPSVIPEPASLILASLGSLGGLAFLACVRK